MSPILKTTTRSGYEYYSKEAGRLDLDSPEQKQNALVVCALLRKEGWTYNAIAGLLGNMQSESSINPNAYYDYVSFSAVSFGLVQWDPTSKYQDWADSNGYSPYDDIEYQVERISLELSTGLGGQYSNRNYGDWVQYNITRQEFISSTDSPYYLAGVFAWNYERSNTVLNGTDAKKESLRKERGGQAEKWYEFITGNPAPGPDQPGGSTGKTGFSTMDLLLYGKRRWKTIVVR